MTDILQVVLMFWASLSDVEATSKLQLARSARRKIVTCLSPSGSEQFFRKLIEFIDNGMGVI